MIELQKDIYFSSKNEDMNLDTIYSVISSSYWGRSRSFEEQKTAFQHSINFGLFYNNNQIAYARVMTDHVFFAYLLDVFVIEQHQGKGYSTLLIDKILNNPELKNIDKWMLATKDAHKLYEKFGFETIKDSSKLMDKMSVRAKNIFEQK